MIPDDRDQAVVLRSVGTFLLYGLAQHEPRAELSGYFGAGCVAAAPGVDCVAGAPNAVAAGSPGARAGGAGICRFGFAKVPGLFANSARVAPEVK